MLNNNINNNYNHPPSNNDSTPNSVLLPFKVATINANSIIDNSREQLVLDMMDHHHIQLCGLSEIHLQSS